MESSRAAFSIYCARIESLQNDTTSWCKSPPAVKQESLPRDIHFFLAIADKLGFVSGS